MTASVFFVGCTASSANASAALVRSQSLQAGGLADVRLAHGGWADHDPLDRDDAEEAAL